MATCIPFQRLSAWLPQIKTWNHRPLISQKPTKSHSHFNILPHTMPYNVSFVKLGANASLTYALLPLSRPFTPPLTPMLPSITLLSSPYLLVQTASW